MWLPLIGCVKVLMKLRVWCWLFQHSRLDIRVHIQLFIWLLDRVSVLFQIQTLMRCYSCSAFPGATGARCPGSSYEVDEGVACTVRALSDSTVVYQVVHCSLSTWKYESSKNNFRYFYAPTLFCLAGKCAQSHRLHRWDGPSLQLLDRQNIQTWQQQVGYKSIKIINQSTINW